MNLDEALGFNYGSDGDVPQAMSPVDDTQEGRLGLEDSASLDNYVSVLQYLNDSLVNFNYTPSPIDIQNVTDDEKVKIVNVFHRMLRGLEVEVDRREEAVEKARVLTLDNSRHESMIATLRERVKDIDAELADVQQKRQTDNEASKKRETKLKSQLAELKQQLVQARNHFSSYRAMLNKRENDYEKLKTTLQKQLSRDKSTVGMTCINLLTSAKGRGRSKKNTVDSAAKILHDEMITAHQEKIQQLSAENEAIKASWMACKDQVDELLEANGNISLEVVPTDVHIRISQQTSDALTEFDPQAQIELPFEFVKDRLNEGLDARVELLRLQYKKIRESTDERSVEEMRQVMGEMSDVISQQDIFIRKALKSPAVADIDAHPLLQDSRRLSSIAELEAERKRFQQEKVEWLEEKVRLDQEQGAAVDSTHQVTETPAKRTTFPPKTPHDIELPPAGSNEDDEAEAAVAYDSPPTSPESQTF